MPSFWADEMANWMRLGGRLIGDSASSLADLADRALQPWDEVLHVAGRRLAGRSVEYEADGVVGRGTIGSFRVMRAGQQLAADVEMVVAEPLWGAHRATELVVRAETVQLLPGPLPELRADRVELVATFDAATVRGWFAAGGVTLDRLGPHDVTGRWKWRRLKLSFAGTPAASGRRVHFLPSRVTVLGRSFAVPARPELSIALPLEVPDGLTLTAAELGDDALTVSAVAYNVTEPVRPEQVLAALNGNGAVELRRPA